MPSSSEVPGPHPDGVTGHPDTIVGLVEAQAARTPDAVAVVGGDAQLTYAELCAGARALGRSLVRLGVGRDVPVGVCVERSLALPVALLGVLEAGGACLPLDPSSPMERLGQILRHAAPPVVIATSSTESTLPAHDGRVIRLDSVRGADVGAPAAPAHAGGDPDDLAYLIYTSGSTGEPKGVMLTNRGLVHHTRAVAELYGLGPADRALQFASIGFDVSIEEIFPTLATGGTVVLRDDDVPILGGAWIDWLDAARPTVLNLPTAHWHAWVRDLRDLGRKVPPRVRLVVVGGERALGSAYALWLQVGGDRVRWINAYGPAETSVTATAFEGPRDRPWPERTDPPIGRPVGRTTVHVLGPRGHRVAEGSPGDLHLGGPGLARGYLGRPDLTAERFVASPDVPGDRLYRTGDLVRVADDGNLAFLGRLDDQVKIRGVRVEPGEVESVLTRHRAIGEAAVVAREDDPGDRRLVAYVVPDRGAGVTVDDLPSASDLRRFLGERLPRHMLPTTFIALDGLPTTPSGKVDRAALPAALDMPRAGPLVGVAPRTATEAAVARAWSRVLGIEDIGVDDDFFDLGGQSLQATQIIAALREELGVEIGLTALFDAPTVAALAGRIDATRTARLRPPRLVPQPRGAGERIPLTLSQEHMWRLETAAPRGFYNVTALHTFSESVEVEDVRAALDHLAARHETLRTSFAVADGGPYQTVASHVDVELEVCDLTGLLDDDGDAELRRRIAEQDATPLDPARAPLLRACLYRLADDRSILAATFDHLICDGTSAYIFLTELVTAHSASARGALPELPALPVQYGDFALWQRARLTEERLDGQVEHWKRALAGMPLGPAVPFDHVPDTPTRRIVARDVAVDAELHGALRRLATRAGTTMFVVAAAAFQAVCARASGRTDIVVSTTLSGRQRAEIERLIGCFHTIGRIRTDLAGDPPFAAIIERTRAAVLGLLDNSDVPFHRIREAAMPPMPSGGGAAFLAAVPTEFQYFPAARDEWTPGAGVVERPGPDHGPDELYFRGQMHPLAVTLLDDGTEMWGTFSYKVDWYDAETIDALATAFVRVLGAVVEDPTIRLSCLPVALTPRRQPGP